MKKKRMFNSGYVIMPNHLHMLIGTHEENIKIEKVIGNAKRFMAYDIVKILKNRKMNDLLYVLENGVTKSERKNGKIHQVFQPSFDVKPCFTEKFVLQKLDYIHHNPVSGKWNLVEDYLDYEHSSTKFYELGIQSKTEIIHFNEFIG
ncbi:MAG: hypothetical protein ISR55_00475 [Bacteroidetes bacterium]|nr:hypothetical protein [Bacteroidota bacterium]